MPEIAILSAKVTADVRGFEAGMDRANKGMNELATNSKRRLGEASAAVTRFSNEIRPVLAGIGLALAATLGYSVKKAVDFDSLKRGLTAVAGSAQEAEKQLARLKEVAKLPGLGFEEAIQGSINLQAAGVSAALAEKALMGFGNALATVGKGKAELQGVIIALTQMSAKGKIMAQEINQIAERVPQIRQILKSAFGTSVAEDIEKLGLTFEQFLTKVTVELDKLEKVTGGSRNALENMMDAVNVAAADLGTIFLPTVEAAAGAIAALAQGFSSLPQPMQSAIGWITAATLAFGLLAAAIVKVHGLIVGLKAVIATGVFVKIGAGLAAWGVGVSSLTPALALAATGWTLMATAAQKAFAVSEQARGEAERVAYVFRDLFNKSLTAASGSIEKLRKEWEFTIAGFEKGKVPTFIVEGFRKEVEKLGYALTEAGIVAQREFAKMSEAAKKAAADFREATLAIGYRAQVGATDRLGALREQLAATVAAINKITNETAVLPTGKGTGGEADNFLAAAAAKKKAEVELLRLVGIKKQIEADILKIEKDSEASKKRQSDWLRQQEEAARRIADIAAHFTSIFSGEAQQRAWIGFAQNANLLAPLDAAQAKLQVIDQSIKSLFEFIDGGNGSQAQVLSAMQAINRLLGDRKHALIQVAAAEKKVKEESDAAALAAFYAARKQKDLLDGVLNFAQKIVGAINGITHGWHEAQIEVGKFNEELQQSVQILSDAAGENVNQTLQEISEAMRKMRIEAEDWAYAFTDAFLYGLRRIREEGFAGLLRSFEEMLFDMAMAFLRSQLVNLMTSFFSNLLGAAIGGGGGVNIGNGASLPGGQTQTGGGDFGGGNMAHVVNNFYITTPDANSFRQSPAQQQIAALQLATANAMRNR